MLTAEQGHIESTVTLGHMHFDGQGGPQCFYTARRLLGIAAGKGHASAQFTFGGMHLNGDGANPDLTLAPEPILT